MTTPSDFVYQQIYRNALRSGANERQANIAAVDGLNKFKKGKFQKAGKLIEDCVMAAKKATRLDSPNKKARA